MALGGVLLLDARGGVELSLGALASLVCALLGSVLLATGLSRRP